MFSLTRSAWLRVSIVLLFTLSLCLPSPVSADGGPIVPSHLWSHLSEEQQIAVVTLDEEDSARVDLFVSLLDTSGASNEVVFFVPLGVQASGFDVQELPQSDFESEVTLEIDLALRRYARGMWTYAPTVLIPLAAGWALINGAWTAPVLAFIGALAGCAQGVAPVASFETPSSHLDVYDLENDTDLDALMEASGLDPAVHETLERLRGQQIAVVRLKTQAAATGGDSDAPADPQGLHLRWRAALVPGEGGPSYTFPLGTGTAWAHPIAVTRVYVVSQGADFEVQYPKLGRDLSERAAPGLAGRVGLSIPIAPEPSYVVDYVLDEETRYWRVIYTESNSAEDIRITRTEGRSTITQAFMRERGRRVYAPVGALLLALLSAILLWTWAWRFASARVLKVRYERRDPALWGSALAWGLLPTLAALLVFGVGYFSFLELSWYVYDEHGVDLEMLFFKLALLATAAASVAILFALTRRRAKRLGVPGRRVLLAYALSLLVYSALYLPLAFGYAALVGAV